MGALDARFRHFGLAPVCAQDRLFVHEDVYEKFVSRLVSKATALKIGNGFADGVHIVSLISDSAVVHIEELVKQAVLSGTKGALRLASRSTFFRHTVLTDVDQSMGVYGDEVLKRKKSGCGNRSLSTGPMEFGSSSCGDVATLFYIIKVAEISSVRAFLRCPVDI